PQQPRPPLRRAARLQPDAGRRQLAEEPLDPAAPQLPPQYRLFVPVDTVQLKDMLGGIQANSDNRHRTAPLLDCIITAWHYRCRRGPSTPTYSRGRCSWVPGCLASLGPRNDGYCAKPIAGLGLRRNRIKTVDPG